MIVHLHGGVAVGEGLGELCLKVLQLLLGLGELRCQLLALRLQLPRSSAEPLSGSLQLGFEAGDFGFQPGDNPGTRLLGRRVALGKEPLGAVDQPHLVKVALLCDDGHLLIASEQRHRGRIA